ncbi:hypothetical protein CISIN_1g036849mg [Citrus sinensis]|uniref:Dirigent protein n=1 Tax=Citrus sinensis TaxID=2711 RepID=A0A067DJX3_CITSI|nr:hypothetical protein CISIN_1g036849mg [Citrus sinensis]
MVDDSLIETTNPQSKLVGRAQGLYSLRGNNKLTVPVHKMPIVGDTGVFLLAGGYAIAKMHWADFKSGNAIVRCNVIIVY